MANYYVSSVNYAALPTWQPSTAYAVGTYVRATSAAFGAERVYKCTTAGTSAGTEPTWNTSNGGTRTDGTVTWTTVIGTESEQLAGNWRAAAGSFWALPTLTTGDVVFFASDHVEARAAAYTILSSGSQMPYFISVSRTGASLPPTAADYAPGAVISTTGNFALSIYGGLWFGVEFKAGVGASGSAGINLGTSGLQSHILTLTDCKLRLASTGTTNWITTDSNVGGGAVILVNTTMTFDGPLGRIGISGSDLLWRDTPTPITFNNTQSSLLIGTNGYSYPGIGIFRGLDFSNVTGTLVTTSSSYVEFLFQGCKLPSLDPISLVSGGTAQTFKSRGNQVRFVQCYTASGGGNWHTLEVGPIGSHAADNVVYAPSGASDGVTRFSHRLRFATGQDSFWHPMSQVSKRWNTTGSKTVSVEICHFGANVPTKKDIYLEVMFNDDSAVPRMKTVLSGGSVFDTGALATSSLDWGGSAPTRANSTSYTLGDAVKVAGNPGKVFIKTNTGSHTSAASLPGAMTSANYGDLITDGTVTWRCGRPLTLSLAINPQSRGNIRCRVFASLKAAGDYLCVDPKLSIA